MNQQPLLKVIAGTPEQPLRIGNLELQCYVLEDETRVLNRTSVLRAIGRTSKAKGGRKYDQEFKLPVFLTARNLEPFIPNDLGENSSPILFEYKGKQMIGYRADFLPQICEIFLDAHAAGVLHDNQIHIATACRILHRGFARIGIIGLIDEATGYQDQRAKTALATILEKFIAKELQPWTKTFPYEFYQEIFRLKGWPGPDGVKRPIIIAQYTNDFVYNRLAPGVFEELKRLNPRSPTGKRRAKFHQWFTPDLGHPKLKEHLAAVIALMKASANWGSFERNINRALPAYKDQIPLPLEEE